MSDTRGMGPKADRVLARFASCVQDGFTGTLQVEFKDGQPQLIRRTDVERLTGRERDSLTRQRAA